jgi:hypothetical protein
MQLLFENICLPPDDPIARLEYSFGSLNESVHKVRKGLWAENGRLRKECEDLKMRLEILEKGLCKKFDDFK